jgi:polyisoprenoid-binding protein YceI
MKTTTQFTLAGLILLLSAFTLNNSINWEISQGHSIKFSGTDAEGIFKTMTGDITFDESNIDSSQFSFTIDVNSINTGNGMKNKHAVSSKWFDASNHPSIQFESNKFSKTDKEYLVTGLLEIHGIEKEITIPFSFINNSFVAKFSINRLDYKVGNTKGMNNKVSNKIKLDVTIPVTSK